MKTKLKEEKVIGQNVWKSKTIRKKLKDESMVGRPQ
jgi:hypothetical protein